MVLLRVLRIGELHARDGDAAAENRNAQLVEIGFGLVDLGQRLRGVALDRGVLHEVGHHEESRHEHHGQSGPGLADVLGPGEHGLDVPGPFSDDEPVEQTHPELGVVRAEFLRFPVELDHHPAEVDDHQGQRHTADGAENRSQNQCPGQRELAEVRYADDRDRGQRRQQPGQVPVDPDAHVVEHRGRRQAQGLGDAQRQHEQADMDVHDHDDDGQRRVQAGPARHQPHPEAQQYGQENQRRGHAAPTDGQQLADERGQRNKHKHDSCKETSELQSVPRGQIIVFRWSPASRFRPQRGAGHSTRKLALSRTKARWPPEPASVAFRGHTMIGCVSCL